MQMDICPTCKQDLPSTPFAESAGNLDKCPKTYKETQGQPDYDLWYCQNYPIEAIKFSHKTDRSGRFQVYAALAVDIRANGLLNPLMLLNHRPKDQFIDHYCMQGLNRLQAMKLLGWSTVPCIVTGGCEFEPKVQVAPEDLHKYFFDGTVIFRDSGTFQRPHLINVTLPQTYKYPAAPTVWNDVRTGVYRHEDYRGESLGGYG